MHSSSPILSKGSLTILPYTQESRMGDLLVYVLCLKVCKKNYIIIVHRDRMNKSIQKIQFIYDQVVYFGSNSCFWFAVGVRSLNVDTLLTLGRNFAGARK